MEEDKKENTNPSGGNGNASRAQIIHHMPKVVSLHVPPAGSPSQCGEDGWYCPNLECSGKFDNQKDRDDHAHWAHAWCWQCNVDLKTPEALNLHYRTILHRECK
ncbi:hypothetical protein TWF718_005654 [Orbilia javanica]|uniref:C2H2-type domain-containing protein n=1 Tax=Orbilia javanica TaxID=47235 RepID=A0AAN8RDP7_9PEZI